MINFILNQINTSDKGIIRKDNAVNRSQIQPFLLNLEEKNYSLRNINIIIIEDNGYYILSHKLDNIQNNLKDIGDNIKFIKTGLFELGEIMKNSFNRLENLLRELLKSKIPNRDDGKKTNFRVKKKYANIKLAGDKKEIKHARRNVRFHCEYNKYDKSNDSKYENCSINQRRVYNFSYTSNKDIVFILKKFRIKYFFTRRLL